MRNRTILAAALFAALVTSCLHLHGFTISQWHRVIDDSKPTEVLSGSAPAIRSDDWVTHLPFAFAQWNHEPRFPKLNSNMGNGQYMLFHPAPVLGSFGLFRPDTWGYFFGPDFGMAWNWSFFVIGLWTLSFLLLQLATGGETLISALGAGILVWSPFFQFWSFNSAPVFIYSCASILLVQSILTMKSRSNLILLGLFLTWDLGCVGVCMYPPYQIPLAYAVAAASLGLLFRIPPRDRPLARILARTGVVGLSLCGAAVIGLYFFHDARSEFQSLTASVYPGHRVIPSGGAWFWRFFGNNVASMSEFGSHPLFGNICEGSSFLLFFPLVIFGMGQDLWKERRRPDPMLIALGAFCLGLFYWSVFGIPESVNNLMLLSRVPGQRARIGLGLADMALIGTYLAKRYRDRRAGNPKPWSIPFLLWAVFLAVLLIQADGSLHLFSRWVNIRYSLLIVGSELLAGYWVLQGRRRAFGLVLALSFVLTTGFNPIVRGGYDFISGNPLSRKIQEINTASNHPLWATFDNCVMPNFVAGLGAHAIDALQAYPHLEIWSQLDPSGANRDHYNRMGFVCLTYNKNPKAVEFSNFSGDSVSIQIHPDNPLFLKLGVKNILFHGEVPKELRAGPHYRLVFTYGHHSILMRKD
ncbi:MAG: DUF7657 domain-containing protein [Bdellovibrionota bacterium]